MQQTTEPKIEQIIQQYRNKLQYLRRSPATVRNYLYTFTQFVQHHNGQVYNLTKQQVEQYVINLKCKTASTQNSVINAIKFYYERVLGKRKPGYYHIERPRREFKLPDIRIMQTPHHTIEQKIDYLINRLATSPLILARP